MSQDLSPADLAACMGSTADGQAAQLGSMRRMSKDVSPADLAALLNPDSGPGSSKEHAVRFEAKPADPAPVALSIDQRLARDLEEKRLTIFATLFAHKLSELPKGQRNYFRLFKMVDSDGSESVDVSEFSKMVRTPANDGGLGLDLDQLPESQLQSLWHSLDTDGSGLISLDEFSRFMKRAPDPWEAAVDDEGNEYFYNASTGETVWEDPRLEEVLDEKSGRSVMRHSITGEYFYNSSDDDDDEDEEDAAALAAAVAASPPPLQLPAVERRSSDRRSSSDSARLSNVRIPLRSDRTSRRSSNGDVHQRV